MEEFQQEYLDGLKEKLGGLEIIILGFENKSQKDLLSDDSYIEFKRVVHSIKGSAGSYDFNFASTICHNMEDFMQEAEMKEITSDFVDTLFKYHNLLTLYCDGQMGAVDINKVDLEQRLLSINPSQVDATTEKVLVVEQSKMLSNIYRRFLGELGVQVSICKDSFQALGRLLEEPFDVLITGNIIKPIDGVSLAGMIEVSNTLNKDIDVYITSSSRLDESHLPNKVVKTFLKNSELGKNIYTEFQKRRQVTREYLDENIVRSSSTKPLKIIFYVDDDLDIHKIAKISLEALSDTQVIYFQSGKELLTALEDDKPDLIILDYVMPEMDGPAVSNYLKKLEQCKNIPIIFLTASNSEKEQVILKDLKPLGVIHKPIRPKNFSLQIMDIWNQ
jgi:CheY-like chemotaxis protein